MPRPKPTLSLLTLRFTQKVERNAESGCLEWRGSFAPGKEYGQFWWGGLDGGPQNISAHRAAWILFKGPIPKGLQVLHKCNNPPCCEVFAKGHLYLGTHHENMRDKELSGHIARGADVYNFKRNGELIQRMKDLFLRGMTVKQICDELKIGWQTVYRAREQDADLKAIMARTKTIRYSNANRKRSA
jgi:hypothetical protein